MKGRKDKGGRTGEGGWGSKMGGMTGCAMTGQVRQVR